MEPPAIEERIQRRAYELYVERGSLFSSGSELEDWLQAENEILSVQALGKCAELFAR